MSLRSGLLAGLFAPLVAAVVWAAPGCGPSALQKAHDAYGTKVDAVLGPEEPLRKRMAVLYNEALTDEAAVRRFDECVLKDAVPFYDALVGKVESIKPEDPALAPAHEILAKFAQARAAYAHHLAQNLDVLKPGKSQVALNARHDAAETAAQDYDLWVHEDPTRIPEARFTELHGIRNDFAERMKTFADGKLAREEFEDYVRKDVLPRVKRLHATRFDDGKEPGMVREAIVTAEEFYAAFADELVAVDRNVRFGKESNRLSVEGDDLLKKFVEELKAVRRRM